MTTGLAASTAVRGRPPEEETSSLSRVHVVLGTDRPLPHGWAVFLVPHGQRYVCVCFPRLQVGPPPQLLVRHTRTHTIDCPTDDVDAMLTAVATKLGVPRDAAWLSYSGRVLQSGRSLRSYGVAAGATVHLAVRGRGGVATFRMHGTYTRSSVRQDSARAESSRPAAVPSRPPPQPSTPPDDQLAKGRPLTDVLQALTRLDDRLVGVLASEDIRLVRCEWLERQPPDFKMPMRQELEKLEKEGVTPSPLLSGAEAVRLIREANRSIGVMSHPWLSPGKMHALFPPTSLPSFSLLSADLF